MRGRGKKKREGKLGGGRGGREEGGGREMSYIQNHQEIIDYPDENK